ncbi:glycoside hydrolase family 31 protein [Entomospira entomophila]|uniref:DUF4968 domain-containing protein n=1 Tax=Entomospira entomophila TaxID=2719988 RepID=A0A968KRF7_9SPIO|nr:TIM-barrel domain-containing protein [Entomospira entomophilus]NIZ40724.1 DUF4968 domain-containing protein [Entomospira entomophilus]WDI34937.1 glycoside hydrolase family 31 protein [Entomospira entomophilus]
MKRLDIVKKIDVLVDRYRLTFDEGIMEIFFLEDAVIRVKATFAEEFEREASYILTKTAWSDAFDEYLGEERVRVQVVSTTVQEEPSSYVIESALLKIVIKKEPFAFMIYDRQGTLLHQDLAGRAITQDHLGRIAHYQVTNRKDDDYYGFGEQSGALNKIGQRIRFCSKDNIGYDSEHSSCLYKHIPFFVKLTGVERTAVGYFYHNTYESFFDAANEMSGYWASYLGAQYAHFGAESGDIDYFFIAGPKIADVVRRYTDLTGKSALMPRYALGYLGSTMYYTELERDCDQAVLQFVQKTKEKELPMDGFFLSSGYTVSQGKRYVFTWNKDRFSDPKKFFQAMQKHHIFVSANIKPGVLVTHPRFEDWQKANLFVKDSTGEVTYRDRWWGGEGAFFDFTQPQAREAWKQEIKKHLLDYGCPAIWNDNNEYDSLEDKEAQCHYDGVLDGQSIARVKPLMATLMAKSSYQALLEHDTSMRPYVTSRAGSAGIQRYAQTWAGDNLTEWKSISYNLSTLLNLGISGLAHVGCDVGGFFGSAPSAMMFLRWVQSGIFYPRFSIHSANTDNTVTEPWMYPEFLPHIREAMQLRYALMPYLYSLNYEAYRSGEPIMRAMIYEFQQERDFHNVHEQFMLGRALLVAPVLRDTKEHHVVLPKGDRWYDIKSGIYHEGGQELRMNVDERSIPVFLRSGEFLVLSADKAKNVQSPVHHLMIFHAPTRDGSFILYEDDGISRNYLKDDYLETTITAHCSAQSIRYDWSLRGNYKSSIQMYTMRIFYDKKAPLKVTVSSRELKQYLDLDDFEAVSLGWHYDHQAKSIVIRLPALQENFSVDIDFGIFDLIGN